MARAGWVYIMTNKKDGTLYVGVSSDLRGRVKKHKEDHYRGSFTARYGLHKLVCYELLPTMEGAVKREKQLKGGSRAKKIALLEGMNPSWNDLYDSLRA